MSATDEEVSKVLRLQRVRRVVVYAALALLILSFFHRVPLLVYLRSALWFAAGALSIVEGMGLRRIGQTAGNTTVNAILYFAVSVLPVWRGY